MPTFNKNKNKPPILRALLEIAHWLQIAITGGLLLSLPMHAQPARASDATTGSVQGTVLDSHDHAVPEATVVLQGPAEGDRRALVTSDDGTFVFRDISPGVVYQITVTAGGFADWNAAVTVEPGQSRTLGGIKLRVQPVKTTRTVTYSREEIATEQFKALEQQRILGFIPNLYVTYEPHPEPLTAKMKFHLAYKNFSNPFFVIRAAASAGIQQASGSPDWSQGAQGYGKRYGDAAAQGFAEGLVGNAILPSLLHQDPRYFYKGTGTKKSRILYAIAAPFIAKGDNGRWQPNYSTWGGALVSASIPNAYYPDSNRGAGPTFKRFGMSMGFHVGGSLAQEFILARFTRKHRKDKEASLGPGVSSSLRRSNLQGKLQ